MATNVIQTMFPADTAALTVIRVASTSSMFLNLFGMQPGAPDTQVTLSGRSFNYNIFNGTQLGAPTTSPLQTAVTIQNPSIGLVQNQCARTNFVMIEYWENLKQLKFVPNQSPDDAMRQAVNYQLAIGAQRLVNWRTSILMGAVRDTCYLVPNQQFGSYVSLTAPSADAGGQQVNFRIPAGNKAKLDMLGAGDILSATWSTASNDIYGDLTQINAAFLQLNGFPLGTVVLTSTGWNAVVKNTALQQISGSVNPVFKTQEQTIINENGDMIRSNFITATIQALPWITWIVTDEGMKIGAPGSETYTKFIDDSYALFLPPMVGEGNRTTRAACFGSMEGQEPVMENVMAAPINRIGTWAWVKGVDNPPAAHSFFLDNWMAMLKIPSAVAYGNIIF